MFVPLALGAWHWACAQIARPVAAGAGGEPGPMHDTFLQEPSVVVFTSRPELPVMCFVSCLVAWVD